MISFDPMDDRVDSTESQLHYWDDVWHINYHSAALYEGLTKPDSSCRFGVIVGAYDETMDTCTITVDEKEHVIHNLALNHPYVVDNDAELVVSYYIIRAAALAIDSAQTAVPLKNLWIDLIE